MKTLLKQTDWPALEQRIRNALKEIQKNEEDADFNGPCIMMHWFFVGERDQLQFDGGDLTRRVSTDGFGIDFRFGKRDQWNNNGSFYSFAFFDLTKPKPLEMCRIMYVYHKQRGIFRNIRLGPGDESPTLEFESTLSLREFCTTAVLQVERVTGLVESDQSE